MPEEMHPQDDRATYLDPYEFSPEERKVAWEYHIKILAGVGQETSYEDALKRLKTGRKERLAMIENETRTDARRLL